MLIEDEGELLERALAGDHSAFEVLVRRSQKKIYNLCYHLVRNPVEAEDLAQEAFTKAFEFLGQFRRQAGFLTWVHRIAVNLVVNRLRRQQTHDKAHHKVATEMRSADGGQGDPVRSLVREELHQLLESAIRLLPDDLRLAFVLREVQGLPYQEVAGMLQCSVLACRTKVCRARARLQETLREYL
ncbi:MAG: sigma-70 family RNA polymerase sigma factor [Armatimonadetes bacterium]|nr:sigma-70 family RNA polymerase sigma factor [Armatimonadota bacterium]